MSPPPIRFHSPLYDERELEAVRGALAAQTTGDGPIGRRVEGRLSKLLAGRRVLLTTSCTHALELSLLALGVGPGQEVITPSFTFVSSANAVASRRGTPRLRGDRRAHAGPRPGGRRATAHAAHRRDPARALRGRRAGHGRAAGHRAPDADCAWWRTPRRAWPRATAAGRSGALGDAGCLSFHETKNVTCGEGGRARDRGPRARAARRDRPREGHEPRGVPARRGRQVHLGRRRHELRAVRRARRASRRAARQARRDPGAPGGDHGALPRRGFRTGRQPQA